MQLFFTTNIEGNKAIFEDQEAVHIAKVLRFQIGDIIHWVDGKGGNYSGKIKNISKRSVEAIVEEHTLSKKSWNNYIHMAIAPPKNIARLDWVIEKLCEIGVDEISLIISQNSERRMVKMEKLKKKLIAASKQSKKAHFATINPPLSFIEFIQKHKSESSSNRFIAHCRKKLTLLVHQVSENNRVIVLIGPEGDFTEEEISLALQNDWIEAGLGEERLRTETAALVACQSIHFVDQMRSKH